MFKPNICRLFDGLHVNALQFRAQLAIVEFVFVAQLNVQLIQVALVLVLAAPFRLGQLGLLFEELGCLLLAVFLRLHHLDLSGRVKKNVV